MARLPEQLCQEAEAEFNREESSDKPRPRGMLQSNQTPGNVGFVKDKESTKEVSHIKSDGADLTAECSL